VIGVLFAAALTFTPCTYGGAKAQCGSMTVPERRGSTRATRPIRLHFVVIRTKATPPKEPLFGIAGGPGQSAIQSFRDGFSTSPFFGALLRGRDVVMLDQRGTGESHPLKCDIFPTDSSTYRYLFPPQTIRECRDRLAKTSDLDAYGSDAAADDLDEVRAALGYAKIVIYGGSYGTTVTLVYMRRHGDRVAAALMEGVVPPWTLVPLPFPRGAQRALDALEVSCSKDPVCSKHFPHFAEEFGKLLERSKAGGIPVGGGAISFEVFADRMRQSLYDSYVASYVPFIVHGAATGDTEPLRKLVAFLSHGISGSLAMGMSLSVSCSESLAFITDAQARDASAETFMKDSRYQAQRAACTSWNVKAVSRDFLDPIRSDAPVLMMDGAEDPAAPPQYGAQEMKYLPNGSQMVIPNTGHDFGSACTLKIELAFLQTYDAKNLNVNCLSAEKRPPFATSLKGLF
jgi:pimeloyl-ACP methyl ester carboxylesterase